MSGSPQNGGGGALVEARDLVKRFPLRRGLFRRAGGASVVAVDGVSFKVSRGETLALVGESGSGKTTVGRLILRLTEPTSGDVLFDGQSVLAMSPARLRELRREVQVIFQDPYGSLNPRMNVETLVGEGLRNSGVKSARRRRDLAAEALSRVGIDPGGALARYPHQFSGGQRQRIGIARALIVKPRFIVCDEPVSSLDVSVQAGILNLLARLQAEEGYAYLFIAHDLSVVRHLSDRIAVMYLGRIVEIGPAREVLESPHHPYTKALLASVPATHPRGRSRGPAVEGDLPSPLALPPGCRFHTRCPRAMDHCRLEDPPSVEIGAGHRSWCFLPVERPPGA